jgi:hypothetical protein
MTLPLASAAIRLRGVPGFPGKVGRPRRGDSVVTAPAEGSNGVALTERAEASLASALPTVEAPWPRLLTLPRAADYLCLGLDVTRELANTGALRATRVTIPAPTTAKRKGGRIALVLLDRLEVDRLVSAWRECRP